jgi:DNA-binding PucR family transcriptional regulator
MSGWHRGRFAIATAYAEAREAVAIATGTGIRGRAVVLDDVLVDYMLRASPHAQRILEQTLRPLVEYDQAHRAELVKTLRAYLSARTNLTKSARLLTVHPNTVVYRLRRIRELTGRDPHAMEDLQILFLALKLSELSSGESDGS